MEGGKGLSQRAARGYVEALLVTGPRESLRLAPGKRVESCQYRYLMEIPVKETGYLQPPENRKWKVVLTSRVSEKQCSLFRPLVSATSFLCIPGAQAEHGHIIICLTLGDL